MNTPAPDQLHFILESAIQAPSADNDHRLRFEMDGGMLKVWYTEDELPMVGGYKRALALLSLGAVAENLIIASSRYGIRVEPELFPDPANPDLLLQFRWQHGAVQTDPLWETIPRRHTNRALIFHGPRLSAADQGRLEEMAASLPGSGCRLVWLDEPVLKRQALRLIRMAEAERFRNRLLHEELFSAIRFDVGWNHSCESGLPPGVLGIERLLRPAFTSLRHWPVMKLMNLIGGYRLLGWRAAGLPCRLAPHLVVIAVTQISDSATFAAGRAFQRIWLEATRLGMAFQPMPASALYALEKAPQESITPLLYQHLRRGWEELLPNEQPLMVFRIGRAAPSVITTGRKPLDYYVPSWRA